jgi:hypothetical protein
MHKFAHNRRTVTSDAPRSSINDGLPGSLARRDSWGFLEPRRLPVRQRRALRRPHVRPGAAAGLPRPARRSRPDIRCTGSTRPHRLSRPPVELARQPGSRPTRLSISSSTFHGSVNKSTLPESWRSALIWNNGIESRAIDFLRPPRDEKSSLTRLSVLLLRPHASRARLAE